LSFDPFGLSTKDLKTEDVLACYNSTSDLYPLLFVLPANAANMLDYPLAHPLPLVLFYLNYYTVIYGRLQFRVFRATNTILLS
jgi:hypothetical protein